MIDYIIKSKTDEELQEALDKSTSMWHLCKLLGYTNRSGRTYTYVKKAYERRGIDIYAKEYVRTSLGKTKRKTDEEVFCENSTYDNQDLKKRIITQKRLEYKCSLCNVTEWMGKPLSLQLDHINGVNNDNRIENLRFLCPNCHTQTPTWGTKSR